MTRLRTLLIGAINLWALSGGALLLLIVVATAINAAGFSANVLARMWGGSVAGLAGYEDGVQMLVGVAALAMFPYAQLHRAHATVDVFMRAAPRWMNRLFGFLSAVLVACLALWMATMLAQGTWQVRADRVETPVLGWPVWVFMPTAVFSCVLWACAALLSPIDAEVAD